jgi:hypothetical protein
MCVFTVLTFLWIINFWLQDNRRCYGEDKLSSMRTQLFSLAIDRGNLNQSAYEPPQPDRGTNRSKSIEALLSLPAAAPTSCFTSSLPLRLSHMEPALELASVAQQLVPSSQHTAPSAVISSQPSGPGAIPQPGRHRSPQRTSGSAVGAAAATSSPPTAVYQVSLVDGCWWEAILSNPAEAVVLLALFLRGTLQAYQEAESLRKELKLAVKHQRHHPDDPLEPIAALEERCNALFEKAPLVPLPMCQSLAPL